MNKQQLEERLKDPWFRAAWESRPPWELKEPKTEVRAELEGKIAEAAQAHPESVRVRVTARGADETVVMDAPRRPQELAEVLSVRDGKPVRVRRYDTATGEWSIVEYEGGYTPKAEVQKDWDPIKKFEEGLGE